MRIFISSYLLGLCSKLQNLSTVSSCHSRQRQNFLAVGLMKSISARGLEIFAFFPIVTIIYE